MRSFRGFRERELANKLKKIGYPHVYFANGHILRCGLQVKTAIVSRIKGKQIKLPEIPREHCIGGGGGIIACKFNSDFYFVNAHLSIPGKGPYDQQIELLQGLLRKLDKRVVLTGDFNKTYDELKPYLPEFDLPSARIKTCICQGALKYWLNKDFDHIFTKGFESIRNGSLTGCSDHKLVYADLE
jgi:endonuclease/exonuclease/phosphatase family metal-dependent hydrolase